VPSHPKCTTKRGGKKKNQKAIAELRGGGKSSGPPAGMCHCWHITARMRRKKSHTTGGEDRPDRDLRAERPSIVGVWASERSTPQKGKKEKRTSLVSYEVLARSQLLGGKKTALNLPPRFVLSKEGKRKKSTQFIGLNRPSFRGEKNEPGRPPFDLPEGRQRHKGGGEAHLGAMFQMAGSN